MFTNSTYDVLKTIAMLWIPAVATLYATLAGVWGFPYPQEITATLMAIDTFLGVVLGISTKHYNDENTSDLGDRGEDLE